MDKLLKEPFIVSVFGPRKSGKSFAMRMWLHKKFAKHFDEIHVLCNSLNYNRDYDEFRKAGYKYKKKFLWYPDPKIDDLEKIFEEQSSEKASFINFQRGDELVYMMKKMAKKRKRLDYPDEVENPTMTFQREPFGFYPIDIGVEPESKRLIDRPKKMKKVLVVLDDVVDSGVLRYHTEIDKYAMRGRHVEVSLISASQRIAPTSINVRDNSDMMILFSPSTVQEMESLIDKFIPTNNKKVVRFRVAQTFNVKYDFVLVDNIETKPYEKIGKSNCVDFLNNKIDIIDVIDINKLC